jgi:ATP-binding cassette subfamily B protein
MYSDLLERYRVADRRLRLLDSKAAYISASPKVIVESISLLFISLWALYAYPTLGASVIPVIGTWAIGAQKLLPSFQQSYNAWSRLAFYRASIVDVKNLLSSQVAIDSTSCISPLSKPPLISFKSVSFAYPDSPFSILTDLDLSFYPGQIVSISGPSGSGKSTLVDLLLTLVPPTSGSILLNRDILASSGSLNYEITSSWRASIAHVPQSQFVFNTTIIDNIILHRTSPVLDLAWLEEVCRVSCLSEFISSLPDGLNTMVGERGFTLSGGQIQRLIIARVLYASRIKPILVLDEATSALDPETEQQVINNILSMYSNSTIFAVTHNPALLKCEHMAIYLSKEGYSLTANLG